MVGDESDMSWHWSRRWLTVERIRMGSSTTSGHTLGEGARRRGRHSVGSARWPDSAACGEGHQSSKAPCWAQGCVWVGVVGFEVGGRSNVGCQNGGRASGHGGELPTGSFVPGLEGHTTSSCLAAVALMDLAVVAGFRRPRGWSSGVWWAVLVLVFNGSSGERLSWWVVLVVAGPSSP
jgi:hypothetical protein